MALIEREAAIHALRLWRGVISVEMAVTEIKALPTIAAAPVVHGRLIHAPSSNDRFEDCYKCSVCGAEYGADYFGPDVNYCTCCGARMDGGDGHEAD